MRALPLEHVGANPVRVFGEVLVECGIGVDRGWSMTENGVLTAVIYDQIVAMGANVSTQI